MTRSTVRFDPGALDRLARSEEVRAASLQAGEAIATEVRRQGHMVGDTTADGTAQQIPLPVEVLADDSGVGAIVIIDHPAGVAEQAKNGVLTRAASAAGFHVH